MKTTEQKLAAAVKKYSKAGKAFDKYYSVKPQCTEKFNALYELSQAAYALIQKLTAELNAELEAAEVIVPVTDDLDVYNTRCAMETDKGWFSCYPFYVRTEGVVTALKFDGSFGIGYFATSADAAAAIISANPDAKIFTRSL